MLEGAYEPEWKPPVRGNRDFSNIPEEFRDAPTYSYAQSVAAGGGHSFSGFSYAADDQDPDGGINEDNPMG